MKLICPGCGFVGGAEAFVPDEYAEKSMDLANELSVAMKVIVLPYVAMFRPRVPEKAKGYRGISWKRVHGILKELKAEVKEGYIQRGHKPARPITGAIWGQAVEVMLYRKLDLPLKGHGYLKSVAYGLADDADRAGEVARNKAERNGSLRRNLAKGRESTENLVPMSSERMKEMWEEKKGKR